MVKNGIFKYENIYSKKINPKYRITLNEGNTPIERLHFLENQTGIPYIYAKREDKNPSGSAKDRSIAYYLSYINSIGIKELIVPSSGNTAISAAMYSKQANIKMYIFISENISKDKEKRLEKAIKNKNLVDIIKSKKPLSDAIKFSKEKNITLLRGSETRYAIEGFKSIGEELKLIRADAIFIPTSSGTTLEGISKILDNIEFHVVQTSKINTVSRMFDNDFKNEKISLADSIVARVTKRQNKIVKIIKKSHGWGWTIENKDIRNAQKLLRKNDIHTSGEGALVVASLLKAIKKGYKFKKVILLFTGHE
jgi:threonine synthase